MLSREDDKARFSLLCTGYTNNFLSILLILMTDKLLLGFFIIECPKSEHILYPAGYDPVAITIVSKSSSCSFNGADLPHFSPSYCYM